MAQGKIYEINSNKCKDIKRMDHNQMKMYLKSIYDAGLAAGQAKEKPNANLHFNAPLALASISLIKGIGKEKLKQIRMAMMAAGAILTDNEVCKAYQEQQEIAKQMKAYGEYTKLIMENPGLPTVAWVDSEIVAEDCCNRWAGDVGTAYIEEYLFAELGMEWPELIVKSDPEKLEEHLICDEGMTEKEAQEAIKRMNWKKAIFINIDTPDSLK